MSAPERIWATANLDGQTWNDEPIYGGEGPETEYIRKDVVAALAARIEELEAQVAGLSDQRDAFVQRRMEERLSTETVERIRQVLWDADHRPGKDSLAWAIELPDLLRDILKELENTEPTTSQVRYPARRRCSRGFWHPVATD